jgi:predicted NACHT family NTPase
VFFDQLEKSSSLKEMMTIPLLASLIVLVFKQTDKLPENKTRLYEIFVALHNGGWDLAKGVQRPSQFSATAKMFVLKRIAASIHKARRREMRDSEVAAIAEEALKAADWNALRGELLRDGLIVEFGPVISFAHHSYQEFLTACHLLGDLNTAPLNEHCEEYLKGSDWWQEVLCFYIDLAGKPQEIRAWLDERLRVVSKYAERRSTAEEKVRFLRQYIDNSFPYAR